MCPERWYGTVRTAAAAALPASHFPRGERRTLGLLWSGAGEGIQSKDRFREGFPTPPPAVYKEHGGFVRHWAVLDRIAVESVLDAYEELTARVRQEAATGNTLRRPLKHRLYRNSLCGRRRENGAGCAPRHVTDRHRGACILHALGRLRTGSEERRLRRGGGRRFTLSTLLQARLYDFWRRRIDRFAGVFLNPGG